MRSAYLLTLLATLAWTTGPLGSKAALLGRGPGGPLLPMQVAGWAVAVGWVGLLAYLVARRRLGLLSAVAPRGWLVLGLMGVIGWVCYPVGMNFAYTRLPLSDALIISYVNPVFTTLCQAAWFGWFGRRVSGWEQAPDTPARVSAGRTGLGLLLCLLGVAVTATEGHLGRLAGLHLGVGAVVALGAAFAWGVYSNLGRFVTMRPGREARGLGDVQNLAAMAIGLAVMAVVLAGQGKLGWLGGYESDLYLGSWGPAAVAVPLIIVVMGIFNYGVGYPVWLVALERGTHAGGAHKLPPINYLLLVLSVLGGWLVLRQPIGEGFWAGAALIAAGNAAVLWPERKRG